jgi:hypothetical protein
MTGSSNGQAAGLPVLFPDRRLQRRRNKAIQEIRI